MLGTVSSSELLFWNLLLNMKFTKTVLLASQHLHKSLYLYLPRAATIDACHSTQFLYVGSDI